MNQRLSSGVVINIVEENSLGAKRGLGLLTSISKTYCVPRSLRAFQYETKYVIARSLRQKTRLEYHGLLRNHHRSQLVDG